MAVSILDCDDQDLPTTAPDDTGLNEAALLRTLSDGVLTLSLNRPARLNALDSPLFDRLRDAAAEAAVDPQVRVVLLRGEGRAFSSGGDLNGAVNPLTEDERVDLLRRRMEVTLILHRMPKPTEIGRAHV